MAQEKLTAEQFQKKYGGAKTDKRRVKVANVELRTVDGIVFDSATEARYYSEFKAAKDAGFIAFVLPQVMFRFPGGKWRCDFLLIYADGQVRVIDVKGYDTPESKRIRKIVEAFYGIEIEVWK